MMAIGGLVNIGLAVQSRWRLLDRTISHVPACGRELSGMGRQAYVVTGQPVCQRPLASSPAIRVVRALTIPRGVCRLAARYLP